MREFLEARFRLLDGPDTVAALHRRTAAAAAAWDWRIAAHHYREAADRAAMLDVVAAAIPTIMSNGQYALAEAFIGDIPADQRGSGFDLILSRVDMQHGDYESAIAASQSVLESSDDDPVQRDHALLNLLTLYLNYGDGERALGFADELSRVTRDANLQQIAAASAQLINVADDGDVDKLARLLTRMATAQRGARPHHFGVTSYNLGWLAYLQDRPDAAMKHAQEALSAFESTSSSVERAAAGIMVAAASAQVGRAGEAHGAIIDLINDPVAPPENELLVEACDVYNSFVSPELSSPLFHRLGADRPLSLEGRRVGALARTRAFIRRQDLVGAAEAFAQYPHGVPCTPGAKAELLATGAYLTCARGGPDALSVARASVEHASKQHAHRWRRMSELLVGESSALTKALAS